MAGMAAEFGGGQETVMIVVLERKGIRTRKGTDRHGEYDGRRTSNALPGSAGPWG